MRLTPKEKQELDDWVEKEYPKSMNRIQSSTPFYQAGKFIIGVGVILYIASAVLSSEALRIASILTLLGGMAIEGLALLNYFKSLSNEDQLKK